MNSFLGALSSREIISALVVVSVLLIVFLTSRSFRTSLKELVKLVVKTQLLTVGLLYLCYFFATLLLLENLGFWGNSLYKDTIFWFVGSISIVFGKIGKKRTIIELVKDYFREAFKLLIILEFALGFYVLGYLSEFFLIVFTSLFLIVHLYTKDKPEYLAFHSFLGRLLAILGLAMIFWVGYSLFTNMALYTIDNLKSFIAPLIFTILVFPFYFFIQLYIVYESLFTRLDVLFSGDKNLRRWIKMRSILICHFNIVRLNKYSNKVRFAMISSKSTYNDELKRLGNKT